MNYLIVSIVMHPQAPQLAAVSGPLASPTGLVSVSHTQLTILIRSLIIGY